MTAGDDADLDRAWWKEAVAYQVYPRSFQDTDGDGVGDLRGVRERLDHLDDLGVDLLWLTPVYESPGADNGYDVADYRAIGEQYGTMADWEDLLAAVHDRDMRLVMDLVVNHTSDEHEWFRRSREDPDGEYGDYYWWVDGDPDVPPNNWESAFGGSAWSYDDEREAWYLHLFDEKQPDLNWSNPAVRREVADLTAWWLEKGVDGFRMDVVNLVSKAPGLPDGDPDADWVGVEQFANGPRLVEYLSELRERTFDRYDAVAIGETPAVDVETARELAGEDGPLDMLFHFEHMGVDHGEDGRWSLGAYDPADLADVLTRWQSGLAGDGWNAPYLENHDQPRSVSRFGDDERYRYESATMLGTLLLTLRGTPFVYQGQALGMTNAAFERLEDVDDVDTLGHVRELMAEADLAYEDVRDLVEARSRDHARTPVQWADAEHAGFTDGEPWLAVNENYGSVNAADQRARERSVLQHYRDLVALRHERDVLVYGDFERLAGGDPVFAYARTLGDERVVVALNLAGEPAPLDVDLPADRTVALSNYASVDEGRLRPYEARVYDA